MFRALVSTALAIVVCGCGSPAQPLSPATARSVPPPRPLWAHWSEALGWPSTTTPAPAAVGHRPGEGLVADVRVNPSNRQAYLDWVQDSSLPPGAVVVELLRRPPSNAIESAYGMHKLPNGIWEFLVTDAHGRVLRRGALPDCQGCHTDAVADSLFGPPRPAPNNGNTEVLR